MIQMLQDLQEAMQGNNTDGGTTDAATVAGEPDGPIASGECDEECMPEVSHRNGTGGSLQDSASGQCAGHVQPSTVKGTGKTEPWISDHFLVPALHHSHLLGKIQLHMRSM